MHQKVDMLFFKGYAQKGKFWDVFFHVLPSALVFPL